MSCLGKWVGENQTYLSCFLHLPSLEMVLKLLDVCDSKWQTSTSNNIVGILDGIPVWTEGGK